MGGKGSGGGGILEHSEERIRGLLRKPCLTYAEIGRRLGVTRERVRQIHDTLFAEEANTGRDRQHICALNQPKESLPVSSLPHLLQKRCDSLGLPFETLYQVGSIYLSRKPCLKQARVNGKLCRLQIGHIVTVDGNEYIRLSRCRAIHFDFSLSMLDDGRWVIRPPDRFGFGMFAEKLYTDKPGAYCNRHDWPQYIEAWHLLRKESS